MHNWCTNKNLTGETCFFFLHFDNTFVVSVVSRFDSSLPFPPFFKSLDCFVSFFSLFNHKVARIEELKTQTIHSGLHMTGKTCFPVDQLLIFNRGCLCVMMLVGGVEAMEREVIMSPNKTWVHFSTAPPIPRPLSSIYKSNRLFASQSPVIYDPAPLTRPASFHFC